MSKPASLKVQFHDPNVARATTFTTDKILDSIELYSLVGMNMIQNANTRSILTDSIGSDWTTEWMVHGHP